MFLEQRKHPFRYLPDVANLLLVSITASVDDLKVLHPATFFMSKHLELLQHTTSYSLPGSSTMTPNGPFIVLPIHSNLFILQGPLRK